MEQQPFREAESRDIPLLIETLALSFNDDPLIRWLIRGDEHRDRALRDYMAFSLEWWGPAGRVITSDDCQACAIWISSEYHRAEIGDDERRRIRQRETFWVAPQGLERYDLLVRLENEKTPAFPHHELAFIGVRPERQGMGLGSALLRYTLDDLDDAGVPAFLFSSNLHNEHFYVRNGFFRFDTIPLPEGPTISCMLKKPTLAA